jgi:hypothetical protein
VRAERGIATLAIDEESACNVGLPWLHRDPFIDFSSVRRSPWHDPRHARSGHRALPGANDVVTPPYDAHRTARWRASDLEQPRFAGMPVHAAHKPGYFYGLHRRHRDSSARPARSALGASGVLTMMEHSAHRRAATRPAI